MAAARPMIPPPHAAGFLAANGWGGAEISPLAGDASFRRYFRVVEGDRTAVLMDAPPEHEDIGPFLHVARHLIARGFSAPHPLAEDRDGGLLLLDDFGDRLVGPLLRREPALEDGIYRDAVALLAELAQVADPGEFAPYDRAVFQREVALLPDWYAPALGLEVDRDAFVAAWDEVLDAVDNPANPVLVLRDYHADNIMLLNRPGLQRLGLLDFQDALAGHAAYDLVSLLQDARRDVSPALEAAMLDHYAVLAGGIDRAAYEILGAQRNTKILGIFTRLWKRDGKPNYVRMHPRIWSYLERNLAHPALGPVARWYAENVPVMMRAAAWEAQPA
jgi:N-acetylmuramate 1-kinase